VAAPRQTDDPLCGARGFERVEGQAWCLAWALEAQARDQPAEVRVADRRLGQEGEVVTELRFVGVERRIEDRTSEGVEGRGSARRDRRRAETGAQ